METNTEYVETEVDRGPFNKERLDLMAGVILRSKYGICNREGHQGKEELNRKYCNFCGRNYIVAINEKQISQDVKRGLRIARERLMSRLKPLYELNS